MGSKLGDRLTIDASSARTVYVLPLCHAVLVKLVAPSILAVSSDASDFSLDQSGIGVVALLTTVARVRGAWLFSQGADPPRDASGHELGCRLAMLDP